MSSKVEISCNGIVFDEFDDFSLNKSIEAFCSYFSFTICQRIANNVGITKGAKITITIENELVFTGFIENIENSQDYNQHYLTISGRDKTAELIDSYILPKQYKQNDFLKLIRLVLDDNGYNNIKINSDIAILPKLIGNSFVAEKNSKIFEFIDNLAKTISVILITDVDGDILITREGADLAVGSLDISNNSINVLNSNLSINSDETYRYIRIIGSQRTEQNKKRSQNVEFIDYKANTNKRLIVDINTNSNRSKLEDIANWYMAIKRGKGSRYNADMQGFLTNITTGLLWQANTILLLKDEANNINGSFLIQGVSYSQSSGGSKTTLSICNLGSFTKFDNNPILSPFVAKFFKLFTGDLASKFN